MKILNLMKGYVGLLSRPKGINCWGKEIFNFSRPTKLLSLVLSYNVTGAQARGGTSNGWQFWDESPSSSSKTCTSTSSSSLILDWLELFFSNKFWSHSTEPWTKLKIIIWRITTFFNFMTFTILMAKYTALIAKYRQPLIFEENLSFF